MTLTTPLKHVDGAMTGMHVAIRLQLQYMQMLVPPISNTQSMALQYIVIECLSASLCACTSDLVSMDMGRTIIHIITRPTFPGHVLYCSVEVRFESERRTRAHRRPRPSKMKASERAVLKMMMNRGQDALDGRVRLVP